MVRLGGKSTQRTSPLALKEQERVRPRWGKADWTDINQAKAMSQRHQDALDIAFQNYSMTTVRNVDLLTHLEFDDPDYFKAFEVPESEDGMATVGKKGRISGSRLPAQSMDAWLGRRHFQGPLTRKASIPDMGDAR